MRSKHPKKGGMTAGELMAQLEADPEWVRQNEEREAQHKARVEQLRAEMEPEEGPLVTELRRVGVHVKTVWDLVHTSESYSSAIPVLCKHLKQAKHPVVLQGIVRALTVPEARGAAAWQILDELKNRSEEPPSELRWVLANALTVLADSEMTEELEALAKDPRFEDCWERLRRAAKRR